MQIAIHADDPEGQEGQCYWNSETKAFRFKSANGWATVVEPLKGPSGDEVQPLPMDCTECGMKGFFYDNDYICIVCREKANGRTNAMLSTRATTVPEVPDEHFMGVSGPTTINS